MTDLNGIDFSYMGNQSSGLSNTHQTEEMSWTCCYCTLENEDSRRKCEACNADRPHAATEELFAQQSVSEWVCRSCDAINSGHRIACIKCSKIGSWVDDGPDQNPAVTEEAKVTDLGTHYDDDCHSIDPLSDDADFSVLPEEPLGDGPAPSDQGSDDELRIVLLGRTGEGKSATGNTIIGDDVFESSISSISVTKYCQRATCRRFGRFIQVIDTPGMYDTEMSIPDITREVVRCVGMTAPGPHAFLLVTRPDRFTEEAQNTVDHFIKTFGEGMLKYLIILFTRRDDLDHAKKCIEEYIDKDSGKLQDLLISCNSRYVTFNNRGRVDEKQNDVQSLIEMIDEMIQMNKGVYTNEMYQEAEKLVLQREDKMRREQEEIRKQQVKQIREDCRRQLQDKEAEYSDIVNQYQMQLLSLQDSHDRESKKTNAEELRKLIKDLRTRQQEELRQIREIAGGKENRVKKEKIDFREKARDDINKGSDFVKDTLIPGLLDLAKVVLPVLISAGLALLKK